jgi:tyrosinase
MHMRDNLLEIHGRSCFLPWHRTYLLDLERRLQDINASVTIPYWKFDQKAKNVFIRDFMGVPDATGMIDYSNSNPLINWKLQLFGVGINQRVRRVNVNNFNPATSKAIRVNNDENQTLDLGDVFSIFARQRSSSDLWGGIEGDPHGSAHVSFTGQISSIGQAPADPLFFLLHCNVDRLWAKWQWLKDKFKTDDVDAYPNQGNGNPSRSGETGIGNFTNDTMWPWNKVTGSSSPGNPRPPHAPGNGMPVSPLANFPSIKPTIAEVIDYQGQISLSNNLHFAYDDVPYEI